MKKIELEIVALSHSITQTHSYAVVLGEVNGLRRLPIVIGGFEAQAIAVALERMSPSRPLTHDLMKNFMLAFNVKLHGVVINDLQEGIFYSKLVCSSANDTVEIDSRTSDALALAVRFGCPVYTYDSILDQAGILMEDDDKKKKVQQVSSEPAGGDDLKNMTLEELNELFTNFYKEHPFTHKSKESIFLKQAVNTNNAVIQLEKTGNKLVVHSAIDNLLKGASGQAVQNMNLIFGIDETAGLKLKANYF